MTERHHGAKYVMLRLDALRLLLPQAEILTLEPAEEAEMSTPHPGAVNDYQGQPVFALTGELDEFIKPCADRPICALLGLADGSYFGLLCNQAELVPAAGLAIRPLPAVMGEAEPALLGIALDEEGPLCLSSAAALWQLIDRLEGIEHGALVYS